jgi:peptidoglycan glycosyltransferase
MLPKGRYSDRQTSPRISDWRSYQQLLQNERAARRRSQRFLGILKVVLNGTVVLGILLLLGPTLYEWSTARWNDLQRQVPPADASVEKTPPALMSFGQVQKLVAEKRFLNLTSARLSVPRALDVWQVSTSLLPQLQKDLLSYMQRKHARHIGIVVMKPDGRMLAMVGFDRTQTIANVCTFSKFPAASLFKIVTAAAAIEQLGFQATTPVAFNGDKYSLYKSQLTDKRNRYTHVLPFAEAFGQSVNPVFGKLGALRLGKKILDQYAGQFGFNQELAFEKDLAPSQVAISDRSYQWAEIASGFNRSTTISVVHAAMIAAVALNQGRLTRPTMVDSVHTSTGELRYQRQNMVVQQTVRPETGRTLQLLMQATVRKGTARRTFRRIGNDKELKDKIIGGKTGSIYNRTRDAKIDWFVGFAQPKSGKQGIVVAVMVAHQKFIGRRAAQYARYIFKRYYQLQSQGQTDSVDSG